MNKFFFKRGFLNPLGILSTHWISQHTWHPPERNRVYSMQHPWVLRTQSMECLLVLVHTVSPVHGVMSSCSASSLSLNSFVSHADSAILQLQGSSTTRPSKFTDQQDCSHGSKPQSLHTDLIQPLKPSQLHFFLAEIDKSIPSSTGKIKGSRLFKKILAKKNKNSNHSPQLQNTEMVRGKAPSRHRPLGINTSN